MNGAGSSEPGTRVGAMGTPVLVILDANGADQSAHPVSTQYATFLGRAVGGLNGIRIEGPDVANTHCKIEAGGEALFIVNQAASGTYVNGTKVTQAPLHTGDIITIGSVKLRFTSVSTRNEKPVRETLAATVAAPSEDTLLATVPMLSPMPTDISPAATTKLPVDDAPVQAVLAETAPRPAASAETVARPAPPTQAEPPGSVCPTCGKPTPQAQFCVHCGQPLARPLPQAEAKHPAQAEAQLCACGQSNLPGNQFCTRCGKALPGARPTICPKCHAVLPLGATFCTQCGAAPEVT